MLLEKYIQASSNVVALNRVLIIIIGLLAIMSIFNYQLAKSLQGEQKIILITPGMAAGDGYVMTGNVASDTYLVQMARYSMGLFLNYTPTSVSQQFEELVRLYSPSTYEVERAALMDLKERVQQSLRITSTYVVEDVIKEDQGRLTIKGKRTRFSQDKISNSFSQDYRLEYEIKNGKFYILKIREA